MANSPFSSMDNLHFLRDFPLPHLIQARCSLKNSGLPWYLRPHAVRQSQCTVKKVPVNIADGSTDEFPNWSIALNQLNQRTKSGWLSLPIGLPFAIHNSQTHRFGFPGLRHPRSTFAASGRWPDLASENAPKKHREDIKGTNQIISELFWMKYRSFSNLNMCGIVFFTTHHYDPDCWWWLVKKTIKPDYWLIGWL